MAAPKNPQISVVAAVIEKDGNYLITKRCAHAVLPGYWEFPGGKVEPGEQNVHALKREVKERLGVTAEIHGKVGENLHDYGEYSVKLTLYEASIKEGKPRVLACASYRWVPLEDLSQYQFPPADKKTTDSLLGRC